MRFNSLLFLVFLAFVAVVACVAALLPGRWRRNWLLAASYAFYASWHWPYLFLLIGVAAVNHFGAQWIVAGPSNRARRGAVILAADVGLLALFKYLDWIVANMNEISGWFGYSLELPLPQWVRPLGISFFVFEAISYTVDIIRKRERIHSFWDFQLFIAFFPKLIAGPILRAKEFLPQIENANARVRAADVQRGLWLLGTGLFLKIVIADALGQFLDGAYARSSDTFGGTDAWLMAVGFGLQIYMDFSSYTRMAIGSALLCGIQLVENFNYPYSARSPVDFWNRWHMSLSRWIRDYLFFPLVGKKATLWGLCRAALISMVICGVWHGAGWTYVLWGLYHGLLIAGYHLLTYRSRQIAPLAPSQDGAFVSSAMPGRIATSLRTIVATGITFALVSLGWLWFRARDVGLAWELWQRALTPWKYRVRALSGLFYVEIALLMVIVWIAPWISRRIEQWFPVTSDGSLPLWRDASGAVLRGLALGLMLALCLLYHRTQTAFIYFQF